MTAPHDTDRFRNTATYTVAITYTVAGGARPATAHRRARRVAAKAAAATARLSDVVAVTATAGLAGHDGQLVAGQRVAFDGANTGPASFTDPGRLLRYLDPEHERALASLEQANARYRRHRQADRERRLAVGCGNAWRSTRGQATSCECVFCEPDRHLDTLTGLSSGMAFFSPRCVCGQGVACPAARCPRHRTTEIVVLDDDPQALHTIVTHLSEVLP